MDVFVTGASGFVGSAVVRELLGVAHTVLGLAHSDAGAARVAGLGAEVHRGAIEDLASLARGAQASEAVIHTAFDHHDHSLFTRSCENDARAIEAIGAALGRDLGGRCTARGRRRGRKHNPRRRAPALGDGARGGRRRGSRRARVRPCACRCRCMATEVRQYADALADMFCAYLVSLSSAPREPRVR